jgi:hypothetical protein
LDRVDGEGDGRARGHRPAAAFDGVVATVCWMRHVPLDDHVVQEGLAAAATTAAAAAKTAKENKK